MNKQAVEYAQNVIDGKINAPYYVKLQCIDAMRIYKGKNTKYCINYDTVKLIESILKLIVFPIGYKQGESVYSGLVGFQWFFIMASLCIVHRDDPTKRRYHTVLLEIARKNGKTFLVAVIFVILFLTQPKLSRFYSVAPDGSLAREIKVALEGIIASSPALNGDYKGKAKFRVLRDSIKCNLKNNEYFPLNYSQHRLDGKLPNVFVVDEVGALPNHYALEAMRSGQITTKNKLGYAISTKYPLVNNPFEDEVRYCKEVLNGNIDDEGVFCLLYEPDNPLNWETDLSVLEHANPLACEVEEIMNDLISMREKAISLPAKRENFLTKHCNIMYTGGNSETFINVADLEECAVDSIDWKGRNVFVGVDLAMSNDNCAVAMVAMDGENLLGHAIAFIPSENIIKKTVSEKVPYQDYINDGTCIACGDYVVDYGAIEEYVSKLEEKFGVTVVAIGYDRYNCISSANKWESEGYRTVEIKQHSSVLHPATKWLEEKITDKKFRYEGKNKLLKINFGNAKCTYDTNMNRYVNKKRSNGKIDEVVALINATYLLYQDEQVNSTFDWIVQ